MNPFYTIPLLPPPVFPLPVFRRRVPTIDRTIPEVCTTGIVENTADAAATSVDYGINPCVWHALPNETLVLWKVRHPVSQNGATLPVNVVIPTGRSSSTVSSGGTTTGTAKVPVVDNKGTKAQGGDVTVPSGTGDETQVSYTTEHLVYINKCAGIFRLLGVTAQTAAAAPTGGDIPAAASVAKK